MDRQGFLTAGTFCLDRNITVDNWPEEDMAATVRSVATSGGGSACNFAIDLRKLDPSVPVATQTLVGADVDGDFLITEAEHHGVDTSGFYTHPRSADSGNRCISFRGNRTQNAYVV